MKSFNLFFALCVFSVSSCYSQTDSSGLLAKAEKELENPATTVSTLLKNQDYLSLHPLTSFRELIRKHATTDLLEISTATEQGTRIQVRVQVVDKDKRPVAAALVYVYQTDARGWYAADQPHVGGNEGDMRHARLFGYALTDAKGSFLLNTIKPSGYPNSELPAHIHIHVEGGKAGSIISELLFDDDPRLKGVIRERAINEGFFIGNPKEGAGAIKQKFDYELQLH